MFTFPPKLDVLCLLIFAAVLASPVSAQTGQKPQKPASSPAPKDKPKEKPKDEKPKEAAAPASKAADPKKLIEVNGEWYTAEEKEKLDKGWKKLDLDWIPPAEVENIGKGMFKINDAWVTAAEADKYYSTEDRPWKIPTKHFLLVSPIARAQLLQLGQEAEDTYTTLKQLLGIEPKLEPRAKITVRIFGSIEAGNEFAARAVERMAHHTGVFAGYVADGDPDKPAVALFDGEPGKTLGFSHAYTRHAVAHKYLEETITDFEKVPEWFIEGIATYCDRYTVTWMRDWAIKNLVTRGGIPKLNNFAKRFGISSDDANGSQTKLHEAGIIVAYYIMAPEKDDAARFKKAIAGINKTRDRDALIDALLDNPNELEKRLKKFANL